jgi:predicted DNA-binding protein
MEKVNGRGRPMQDDPMIQAPSFRIHESLYNEVKDMAQKLGKTQSEIFQEAIESYVHAQKMLLKIIAK